MTYCSDCPPEGYPTDETRCNDCPRRVPLCRSELFYDKVARTIVPIMEPSKHRRCLPKGECAYCDAYGDDPMMPRHYASAKCQSGSYAHCTCDVCY